MLKCSYITENGKPSKETFIIDCKYVDFINKQVKKETRVNIDDRLNTLPAGLLLYIHELVR
jgi:hypothetical protein